ncbi:MAG: hypothetical protein HY721_00695 [Planctomycetes bacterium]|nr:hypothetical protein [Planctomycetota bacterium]
MRWPVLIGQVKAGEGGHGELEFEAEEGGTLPFGKASVADFVDFGVEIRDPEGTVVLKGALPDIVCEAEGEDREHDGGDDGHEGDGDGDGMDGHDGDGDGDDGHEGDGDGMDGGHEGDGDGTDGHDDGMDGPPDGGGGGLPAPEEPMFVVVGEFDAPFLRGDSNRDGAVDLADAVTALA